MIDNELQQKRLVAAVIDIGILAALGVGMSGLGFAMSCSGALSRSDFLGSYALSMLWVMYTLVGLTYVLCRDVLAGDRSLGKKAVDIRVQTTARSPISLIECVKRNAIFAVGFLLSFVSAVVQLVPLLGCLVACILWPFRILAGLFSLAAVVYELIQIIQDPGGIRLGDQIAGTRVVR